MSVNIKSIAYGGGVYIAVNGDQILKSTDGNNWTVVMERDQTSNNNHLTRVLYGGGRFLVGGECSTWLTSNYGTNWKEYTSAGFLLGAVYKGSSFLVTYGASDYNVKIPISMGNSDWRYTNKIIDSMAVIDDVIYGMEGATLCRLNESTDQWEVCISGTGISGNLFSAGGRLLLGGNGKTYEFIKNASGNYRSFIQLSGISGEIIDACTYNRRAYLLTASNLYENETPVLTISGSYTCCCFGGDKKVHLALNDSSLSTHTPSSSCPGFDIQSMAYGNGVYMAAAGDRILKSTDGTNWTVSVTTYMEMDNILYGDGVFLATGGNVYYYTADNGATWRDADSASKLTGTAYGDGSFLLNFNYGAGTGKLDCSTLQLSWLDNSVMGKAAYANGAFYSINKEGLHKLDAAGKWQKVFSYSFSDDENNCLKGFGTRLFLGSNGKTYELIKNTAGEYASVSVLSAVQGQMIDGCEKDGERYLLTYQAVYQNEGKMASPSGSHYICCCIGGDGKVHTLSGNGVFAAETPPATGFVIRSVAYGDGVYMAAAGDRILKSLDGKKWEVSANPYTEMDNILYGDGVFLVTGGNTYYYTADNGATWYDGDSASKLTGTAYGNGSFLLNFNYGSGTGKLDCSTLRITWLNNSIMGKAAYANGAFYSINKEGLHKLDSTGKWQKVFSYSFPENNTSLSGLGNRLLFGGNGKTYEFKRNTAGEYYALGLLPGIEGQMTDACQLNGVTYILTNNRFYQGSLLTHRFDDGQYQSIAPGKFNKRGVTDPVPCILFAAGSKCAFYEPVETVSSYTIQSVSYHNGVYIAATADRVLKSFDCQTWFSAKKLARPDRMELTKVVFGDGKFLVCGTWNYFVTEDDGLSWLEEVSEQPMNYAAYGDGRFITTGSGSLTQQIDSGTLSLTVLGGVVMVDDVAYWGDKFIAVKNGTEDRKLYVLTEDGIWEDDRISALPALTKAAKTLRVVNGTAYLGVNDTTKAIGYIQGAYQVYDILEGYLIDACELQGYNYLLTSSTLYEDDYPIKTAPTGRVFSCCTAGKVISSAATRAANTDAGVVQAITKPSSGGSGNSGTEPVKPEEVVRVYDKETTASYTVITDTHGRPWGSRTAHFDLGDNTRSEGTEGAFQHMDPVEVTNADMILYGNHDVAEYQRNARRLQIWVDPDPKKKMVFYGFDSCRDGREGFRDYEIPLYQIEDMARDIQNNRHHNWDIAVLTHIPLFRHENAGMGECWTEDVPGNTALLKELIYNFKIHSNYKVNGKVFDFSRSDGNVIGCFCGHIHNSVIWAEEYFDGDPIPGKIYMEAFMTNGETTYTTSRNNDSGLYDPKENPNTIDIVFSKDPKKRTVNGHSYDTPTYRHVGGSEVKPKERYRGAYGALVMGYSVHGDYYPKFHTDGTYLGYSRTDTPGVDGFDGGGNYGSSWKWNSPITVYMNANSKRVTGLRFGSEGRLRYYWENGLEKEIPYYETAPVRFDANGFHWEFNGGKYQHPRASTFKFSKSSQSYPAFDDNGRYIGWSGTSKGYLTGGRGSGITSRSWDFYGNMRLYVNSELKWNLVKSIVFDTNGRLQYFVYGSENYRYSDLDGKVKVVTDQGVKWCFQNRLLTEAHDRPESEYYDDRGNYNYKKFTYYGYQMVFGGGYLQSYRELNNLNVELSGANIYDPTLTDTQNGWKCEYTVYYYRSLADLISNRSFDSHIANTLIFGVQQSKGYAISNLKYQNRGTYAKINDYYFYSDGTNGYRMVELI